MLDQNIKKVLLKYKDLVPSDIFERQLKVYKTKLDKANVIVGPRRSGKTYFLYHMIRNYKGSSPVLINFEDNMLGELGSEDLNRIIENSKEIFGNKLSFFFDEIQSIDNWDRFIISLLNEHYEVYVTGSNSKLLSKEISTSLRGKSLPYLMLPFSFKEYLGINNVRLERNFEFTDKVFDIKKHFDNYMKYGGFPEVVLTEPLPLKNKLVNNYFDSVLYKDIVDRLKLKNIRLIEITMKYLLNLYGNIFSISAFERYLKSNKIPYSLEDLYSILRSLQDVFMVSYVKGYSKSFKKSEFSRSKVYLFDVGYVHFLSYEPEDYGRILENLVFIELFRRIGEIENRNIFYYRSSNDEECDFVVMKRDKVAEVLQVTYDLNDRNRGREIRGLMNALEFFKLDEGLILTLDQEEEIAENNKKIIVKPVWKWMLGV